jgi:hypothetical protein
MPRRPFTTRLKAKNVDDLREEVQSQLARLNLEASDHRIYPFFIPDLAVGTLTASNNLVVPSRNRRYIQMQLSGFGTGAGSALTVTLYQGTATPFGAGDRILQIVLNAAAGWRSGSTSSIINVGKESVNATTGWGLDITAAGAAWTNVLVELVYEDFVPYARHAN